MRDLLEVAKFTFKEMIKKKAFIITNVIIFIIIVLGFNLPTIFNAFDINLTDAFVDKIIINDENNLFENNLSYLENLELAAEYEFTNESLDINESKTKINEEEINYIIDIKIINDEVNFEIVSINDSVNYTVETILTSLQSTYTGLQISKLNLSEDELKALNPIFNRNIISSVEGASTADDSGEMAVGSALAFLLFFAIYFFAFQVSTAVTTEKTSKIVETLLTSTSSKNIVLGKTLGSGLVGLLQIFSITLVIVVSAFLFLPESALDMAFSYLDGASSIYGIALIYFIVGYFFFAFLFALCGSLVNRIEDVQMANAPVSFIGVIGFYLGYFSSLAPGSAINLIASYIPISSPFTMPSRFATGASSLLDVSISLIILLITTLLVAYVSIKIYSNAILNNGTRFNIKELVKMFKQKDGI